MPFSKTAAAIVGLVALSAASPMRIPPRVPSSQFEHIRLRRQDNTTTPTEPDVTEPVDDGVDWCANADLTTAEGAASVWNDRGVGSYLDNYLSTNGESGWLNNLASASFPNSGDAGAFGCGSRDQSCLSALPDCPTMDAAGHGAEYWIFNAAQKMQDAFERAHENLQDSVIDSSLTVSSINSDFAVTLTSNEEILRYVAAAFGMAGGLVGYGSGALVNGLKTTATMFGGAFAASANNPPISVTAGKEMDSMLKEIFNAERNLLDSTLKTAVGDGDFASLPDQAGDYSTSVAKFMVDGRFLLQGELVADYFSAGYDFLNKKLVDVALQTFGYSVLADHNYEGADSCGEQYGAFWLDIDGGRCMRLVYKDGDNTYWPAGEEVINKAQDSYGINIFDYYTAACDCAINGAGEPDVNALPEDGTPAQCFYNIPCMDAENCLELNDEWSICWPIDFNEVMSWPDKS